MDAFVGGPGVLLGYGKKGDNLCLWDMAEEAPKLNFQGPSPVHLGFCPQFPPPLGTKTTSTKLSKASIRRFRCGQIDDTETFSSFRCLIEWTFRIISIGRRGPSPNTKKEPNSDGLQPASDALQTASMGRRGPHKIARLFQVTQLASSLAASWLQVFLLSH